MADLEIYPLRQVEVRLKVADGPPLYGDVPMDNPDSAVGVMAKMLSEMDREYLCVVNLDTKLKPLNFNIVSVGGIDACQVPVANVFKSAILTNAGKVICFHNHPSGDTAPSREDMEITKRLVEVGRLMDIPLVDHIIVGGNNREKYSLYENMPQLFHQPQKQSVLGELEDQKSYMSEHPAKSGKTVSKSTEDISL